jgi:hydroxypyruvate reductase
LIASPAELRAALVGALGEALAALDPARLVEAALPPLPPRRARVLVVAAGKAAPGMARGALARWPDRIERALVVTPLPFPFPFPFPYPISEIGNGNGSGNGNGKNAPQVEVIAAAHPVPDARSAAAAERALGLAASLGPQDLLLALISGGASALLSAAPEGTGLPEKQALCAALLDRGVPIREVNLVRRHFSRVKGGRLGRAASWGARVLTLIVGDVIGGAPHDVGSGPTVPDPTTLEEARAVLASAGIAEPRGMSESVKPGEFRARAKLLADPAVLARAVAEALERRGLRAVVDEPDEGDARSIAERRAARAEALAPGEAAVIATEPTLALPPRRGRGGRAGWVALAAMARLPVDVALLCAASDGVDGSSGAAGALVTRADAERAGAGAIEASLAAFDDATLHEALGTHLPGRPTGHNLTDVHVVARLPPVG